MDAPLVVGKRFCGPPDTGNGGYVAGLLAARVGVGRPVQVTLRQPPPLEVAMLVGPGDDQSVGDDGIVATFGGAVIATAQPSDVSADLVPPVSFGVAREAEARYGGLVRHPFPGCFVCGTDRPVGDGLGLRPGPVGDDLADTDATVATSWVPDASLAVDGRVGPELVWAALDCPGGWSNDLVGRPMVLGRMTASVDAVPEVGDHCVVVGRLLGVDGRKSFTASTVYDPDGRVLGHAESTWIAV